MLYYVISSNNLWTSKILLVSIGLKSTEKTPFNVVFLHY